jgi:hypothetical protein
MLWLLESNLRRFEPHRDHLRGEQRRSGAVMLRRIKLRRLVPFPPHGVAEAFVLIPIILLVAWWRMRRNSRPFLALRHHDWMENLLSPGRNGWGFSVCPFLLS